MINKNSDENKVRTDKRFSAGLALYLVTLAVLMMTGSSTAAMVYADSSNTNSISGSTGSTSSDNNPVSSSSQGSTAHCDRPGYPSCSAFGSEAGKTAPGTSCPPGHSKAFCNGYEYASGGSGRGYIQGVADPTHCDQPGFLHAMT